MDTFVALADPTRRQIIESLAGGERCFGDLAEQFAISGPAVSQHLKALKEVGLVVSRRDAQRRIYRLRDGGLDDIHRWLRRIDRFWADRLDRLEQVLLEEQEQS